MKVELNSDADAAVKALGEAKDVSSQLSCHGEGQDKTYTYENFVLNTYPLDGKDRVLEIVVKAAGIPTAKGVQVGDAVSAVTDAYGNDFKQVGMYYAYDAGDGKSLQFFVQGNSLLSAGTDHHAADRQMASCCFFGEDAETKEVFLDVLC